MLKNIDVINKIHEECRQIDALSARITAICDMEELDIFELADSKDGIFTDSIQRHILSVAALLRLLTEDYKATLVSTDFFADEFLGHTRRIEADKEVLCEEWDSVMEEIWSLEAFCETELKSYLQMTQSCYRHEFEPIKIVFGEDSICQDGFWEIPSCSPSR
ncbi:MAG: hypothetical protein Q4C12_01670 [Clostridia bacterium]|nr:hypothetical protein [Clostridia bacterium]